MSYSLILQCSPRPQGNSAHAAQLVRETLEMSTKGQHGGKKHKGPLAGENSGPPPHTSATPNVQVLRLCDYTIAPCIGCDICAIPQSHTRFFLGCPLSKQDESEVVLTALMQASILYFISPIYHYHLPAQAKAVLDRLQPFYWMQMNKIPYPPNCIKGRHQVSIFVAGQPQGQKLFDGSRLSLRYSLRSAGYTTEDSLGLRGLDGRNALRDSPDAQGLIREIVNRTLNRQAQSLSGDGAP